MGIRYVPNGNIFDSDLQTIVAPVNCVGVMGRGLAKEMAIRVKGLCVAYQRECAIGSLTVGSLFLYPSTRHRVLCFPTKIHWRDASELDWIEIGLKAFVEAYEYLGITGIAFPMLGCGCGQLSWDAVKPLMEKYLGGLPIDVEIYV